MHWVCQTGEKDQKAGVKDHRKPLIGNEKKNIFPTVGNAAFRFFQSLEKVK
jgi:hypothetical protein